MRNPVVQLVVLGIFAAVVGAALSFALPLGGLYLNLVPTVLGALAVALVGWTFYHGFEGTASMVWPIPRGRAVTSTQVRERGLTKTLSLFASAEGGSALSKADIAALLRDVTARQLVLRGADPADPFAAADGIVGPDLLSLCRRSAAGQPVPTLSRRRLDAYLKEILAL